MIQVGVNGQAKPVVDIKVGVSGEAKTVSRMYVGVGGEAKLVYDNTVQKVIVRPFSRSLDRAQPGNYAWISNDPAVILEDSSSRMITYGSTVSQTVGCADHWSMDRQMISYYKLTALLESGSEIDLGAIARMGRSVDINVTSTLSVSAWGQGQYAYSGNASIVPVEGFLNETKTIMIPSDVSPTAEIYHYNSDGTNATVPGLFFYMSSNWWVVSGSVTGAATTTITINRVTIDGESVPVEIDYDWGDR